MEYQRKEWDGDEMGLDERKGNGRKKRKGKRWKEMRKEGDGRRKEGKG